MQQDLLPHTGLTPVHFPVWAQVRVSEPEVIVYPSSHVYVTILPAAVPDELYCALGTSSGFGQVISSKKKKKCPWHERRENLHIRVVPFICDRFLQW